MKKQTVVLLWGWTGGHIFPLISLFHALKKRGDFEFVFIWERGESLEKSIAAKEWIPFRWIFCWKLRRYFDIRTIFVPFLIKFGWLQSLWIFLRNRPSFVFSKGWYVSLPAAIAAWMLRIPVYLHESDSVPGLANRLVARFSEKVFLGFSEASKYFPSTPTQVVGQILNDAVIATAHPNESRIFDQSSRPKLLVVAGSLGSARVFSAMIDHPALFEKFSIVVVLGTLNTSFRASFETLGAKTYDFLTQTDMMQAYAEADIAVTRAGATTLAEIAAFGVQMIIIPLEGAANDHQNANARSFATKGAIIVRESEIEKLPEVLSQFEEYQKTQADLKGYSSGAQAILDTIVQ